MASEEPSQKKPTLVDRRSTEEPPTVVALVATVPMGEATPAASLELLRVRVGRPMATVAAAGMLKLSMMEKALLSCLDTGYRFPRQDVIFSCRIMIIFHLVSKLETLFCPSL